MAIAAKIASDGDSVFKFSEIFVNKRSHVKPIPQLAAVLDARRKNVLG